MTAIEGGGPAVCCAGQRQDQPPCQAIACESGGPKATRDSTTGRRTEAPANSSCRPASIPDKPAKRGKPLWHNPSFSVRIVNRTKSTGKDAATLLGPSFASATRRLRARREPKLLSSLKVCRCLRAITNSLENTSTKIKSLSKRRTGVDRTGKIGQSLVDLSDRELVPRTIIIRIGVVRVQPNCVVIIFESLIRFANFIPSQPTVGVSAALIRAYSYCLVKIRDGAR